MRCDRGPNALFRSPCAVLAPIGPRLHTDNCLEGSLILIDRRTEDLLLSQPTADVAFRDVLLERKISSFRLNPAQIAELAAIASELAIEIEMREQAFEIAAVAKLVELFVRICRFRTNVGSGQWDVWNMNQVMSYVRERYDESFSLSFIAARCALSPTAFSREFKRVLGSPLFEFINKVRIQKACELLKHSRKTIIEIATDVGYNNVSFFNRYFRKIVSMSPTMYRSVAQR